MNFVKKIAIMGGTFDPIHIGHLVTAEAVRAEFFIDEVLFIPTGTPPHKSKRAVTSSEHRYLMSVLATAANPHFNVSRLEIEREGFTYTIDTLRELRALYGENTKLYFITGADAINQILLWKDAQELFNLCTFIAVTRPGYAQKELFERVEKLKRQFKHEIKFLEVPALAISSSDIRDRKRNSRPIKYLVTESVENYIEKHRLYQEEMYLEIDTKASMEEYVKQRLSPKRYSHTKQVILMALELAAIYEVNEEKVFVAALFHDIAKEFSHEELLEACKKYAIDLDDYEKENLEVVHGKVGAKILEDVWGIKDKEVLSSIIFHTVANAHMGKIEKIIYLADMLELTRKPFKGIDELRAYAKKDLDFAMFKALEASKEYIEEGLYKKMHPISEQLLEKYRNTGWNVCQRGVRD
jgi:nicotinate-nucleotide adenylyltransferase